MRKLVATLFLVTTAVFFGIPLLLGFALRGLVIGWNRARRAGHPFGVAATGREIRGVWVAEWNKVHRPFLETLIWGAPRRPLPEKLPLGLGFALRLAGAMPGVVLIGMGGRTGRVLAEAFDQHEQRVRWQQQLGDPENVDRAVLATWERIEAHIPPDQDRLRWLSSATGIAFVDLDFARNVRNEVAHPTGPVPVDRLYAALEILSRAENTLRARWG